MTFRTSASIIALIKALGGSGAKYDDSVGIISVTNADATMGDVAALLNEVNTAGDHVLFDVSALDAGMYLCTIYINDRHYRIADLVTGYDAVGFFSPSDTLADIIRNGGGSTGKHYTARWDKTSAQMTRHNDAAAFTTTTTHMAHHGSVDADYENPFDSIYPWSGRKLCNIDMAAYRALTSGDSIEDCVTAWEGDADFSYNDDNGVWVYTPPFYGQSYSLGNYIYFDVTNEYLPNYVYYPAQITGRWHGVKVSLTIDGVSKNCLLPKIGMPCKRERLDTIKSYADNWGAGLVTVFELDASLLLYLVEFANYNAQNAIGNGVSGLYREDASDYIQSAATDSTVVQVAYNATNVGVCIPGAIFDIGTSKGGVQVGSFIVQSAEQDGGDATKLNVTLDRAVTVATTNLWSVHGLSNTADEDIGSGSGYIGTNGKANAYYRGEVLWGNLWQYTLGAYHEKDTNHVWLAHDSAEADNYNAIDTTAHVDTGIAISDTNGYIAALAFPSSLLSAPAFATGTDSNSSGSSNPVGDYFYNAPTSNTILLVGGYASGGAYGGPFYWNWHDAASSSAWPYGGRPRLKTP